MLSPGSGTQECPSRIQYSFCWTHLYIGHPNIQEKGIKHTPDIFLFQVIIIYLCLERFSFSSTSDVSFDSSSVPGHRLTQLLLPNIYNPNSPY